jgi:hypothetical protein
MLRTTLLIAMVTLAGCATPPRAPDTAAAAPKPPCGTASRIPQSNCAPGSTYSADDIKSTGVPGNSVANSLQMLDPAVHR